MLGKCAGDEEPHNNTSVKEKCIIFFIRNKLVARTLDSDILCYLCAGQVFLTSERERKRERERERERKRERDVRRATKEIHERNSLLNVALPQLPHTKKKDRGE